MRLPPKSTTPTKPIQIDLINITNQKREYGKEHKIQLMKFNKASLLVIWLRCGPLACQLCFGTRDSIVF